MINCLVILGLVLNTFGAILLAFPFFKSKEEIEELSKPKYDSNPQIMISLLYDRKVGRWGVILLIAGFLVQIASFFIG
jgi:hypothetical protein